MKKTILAIESSCDETAMSVVQAEETSAGFEFEVLSNVVASQIDLHKQFGGVYPEMASRAHLEAMIPTLQEALRPLGEIFNFQFSIFNQTSNSNDKIFKMIFEKIDAIAVTSGPGLIGSLLMGVETAQILASYFDKPLISVNHLEGHIYAAFCGEVKKLTPSSTLREERNRSDSNESMSEGSKIKNQKLVSSLPRDDNSKFENLDIGNSFKIQNSKFKITKEGIFPILALVVSGGHTSLILMKDHLKYKTVGQTIDDAAGEAFDKVARILDLGYPGGPAIEKLAKEGDENAVKLPLSMLNSGDLNFSFSGLKTAVLYKTKNPATGEKRGFNKADLAASFQKTVCEILTKKTIAAAKKYAPKTIILSGGVSANQYLRDYFTKCLSPKSCDLSPTILAPVRELSTDNAVGIAIAGALRFMAGNTTDWKSLEANDSWKIDNNQVKSQKSKVDENA